MILFYSGSTTADNTPEHALAEDKPGVMLTYWEMEGGYKKSDTIRRFENHKKRRKNEGESRNSASRP